MVDVDKRVTFTEFITEYPSFARAVAIVLIFVIGIIGSTIIKALEPDVWHTFETPAVELHCYGPESRDTIERHDLSQCVAER